MAPLHQEAAIAPEDYTKSLPLHQEIAPKRLRLHKEIVVQWCNRVSTSKDFFLFKEIFAIAREKKEIQNKRKYEGNLKN